MKNIRKDIKLNWFVNNMCDNCYIRGILKKNNSKLTKNEKNQSFNQRNHKLS